VPVQALSIVFRAKFREILHREGLSDLADQAAWRRDWVVHSQAAGDGRASLRYLAPYVFRVAIGDHRIVSCDDGQVTFTYRRSGSNRPRKMTLDATEFIRRFLQHVLPKGFRRIRTYGWLSPAAKKRFATVRTLLNALEHPNSNRLPFTIILACPKCQGAMRRIADFHRTRGPPEELHCAA